MNPLNQFVVPEGRLWTNPNRHGNFPYIYQVESHPLVSDTTHMHTILVTIVDTSREARKSLYEREKSLYVPLGPESLMDSQGGFQTFTWIPFPYAGLAVVTGLFELTDGTILYARPLGSKDPIDDIVVCWVADAYVLSLVLEFSSDLNSQ
jgi:hypothetical protein